ncbi:ABC transporter permease [Nocardia puris]|uniref:ABC-2 type transport system permease protein n=1 Tax=Nocardia puris TaxID=208602 RepID=A0A366DWI1_9NOCA|nr:ABC transporter permease [Nocardia puris]RBO94461.1 ABC-2 type transport system permease protein [Nocardia puris]
MTAPDTAWLRAVRLIARRELLAQTRTKAFRLGLAITAVGIVAAAVIYSLFLRDDGQPAFDVAAAGVDAAVVTPLAGAGKAAGLELTVTDGLTAEEARARVTDGDADAALLPGDGDGVVAVVEDDLDPALGSVLTGVVRGVALERALAARGADSAAVAAAMTGATVTVEAAEPVDPQRGEKVGMAWFVLILLLISVLGFGVYVAMGVVEEKSNRVVELLLSTARPLQLLWGKVLGIGAAALIQVVVLSVVGAAAGSAAGLITLSGTAAVVIAGALVWFVLGYLLFALVYAAAGALVSRQEEVQGVTTPVMLIVMVCYFVSIFAIGSPDNPLSVIAAWIPPFSAFVMPVRTAAGDVAPWEIAGSLALMVAACAAVAWLAARIYSRSVLHTGSRVPWKQALRG